MKRSAFTLIELLTVVAIVAAVAAILFPVLAAAKKSGKRAATISNLRQCASALLLYVSDSGDDRDLPPIDRARTVLSTMPTCDLADTWRSSCGESFGDPLIGSYGYIRGLRLFQGNDGLQRLRNGNNPIIMVSIFYADPVPPPFHGENPSPELCPGDTCRMPTGIVGVRMDGSVRSTKIAYHPSPGVTLQFSWPNAFLGDDTIWTKVQ